MFLNTKPSSKNKDLYYKTNNISLDFASSPIKNCKKIIKRNTRTNSYNSFFYNQTEAISTYKNNNNNNNNNHIISVDSNSKINLKKNIFAFSNKIRNLNINNNNIKKNKDNNFNKENIKNITAHQSTSNLSKFNKEKILYRNNNTLILNNNNKNNIINKDKNKTLIYKNKPQPVLLDSIFNYNKACYDIEENSKNSTKSKKSKSKSKYNNNNDKNRIKYLNLNFKNFCNKTTKNSATKKKNRNNLELNSNNKLELSTEKNNNNNELLSEFELLYSCLNKKKSDKYRSKSHKKKNNTLNKKNKKYNLLLDKNILNNDSLLGIIYENKKIKQKNEELSKQFEHIKKEFEIIKKDNQDIKEELKEKTKYLKDIKLTMDIFSQELLKLQNLTKENDNNIENNINCDNNNIKKEKPKYLIEVNIKKNNNEINNNINNNSIYINNNENIKVKNINTKNINTKNINNIIINPVSNIKKSETVINSSNNNNKLEKIHQLSLSNINKLISQQNKERGSSLDHNNIQDTSKLINIETKDTTEKENNECLNEKWPSSTLNLEKKEKGEIEESIEEKSSDLSNISLADNLNINQEMYNMALNKSKKKQKFDLNVKFCKKNENNINNIDEEIIKKMPRKLNFIKNDNFNEEFMKYYDIFSNSWRKEVDKMLKKGK